MSDLELKEVETVRRSSVALDQITAARQQWQRQNRQPKAITAREALQALYFEAYVVWTAAQNLSCGETLTDEDRERLTLTCSRIQVITEEITR